MNKEKPARKASELSELLAAQKNIIVNNVMKQREIIIKAFIAETGLKPSECEQVIMADNNEIRWFIRKRS